MTVKVEGLRDLEKAMEDLTKASGRGVLRRAGTKALMPVRDAAAAMAPKDQGELAESIAVSTKLSPAQRKKHRPEKRMNASAAEVFVGASWPEGAHAHLQEFGTVNHNPQPFMRPAWDANQAGVMASLRAELWAEIEKAQKRAARKAAKLAAKG